MTNPEDPNKHLFRNRPGSKPELGHINKRQFMLEGATLEPFGPLGYVMKPHIDYLEWTDTPEGRQHIIDTTGLYEGHPDLDSIINEHQRAVLMRGLANADKYWPWPEPKGSYIPPGYDEDYPMLSKPPVT